MSVRPGPAYPFPYAKADPTPTAADPVAEAFVDSELGKEALTYLLESGKEGSVHIDHVLEHNEEPEYMARLLAYKLTVAACKRMEESGIAQAEVAKRLKMPAARLRQLLDTANPSKSLDDLAALLRALRS